jgi:hypothetical protein
MGAIGMCEIQLWSSKVGFKSKHGIFLISKNSLNGFWDLSWYQPMLGIYQFVYSLVLVFKNDFK